MDEGIIVNWNFFGEKHGKNSRDQHFSVLTKHVYDESLTHLISTTKDLVDAINMRSIKSKENRQLKNISSLTGNY